MFGAHEAFASFSGVPTNGREAEGFFRVSPRNERHFCTVVLNLEYTVVPAKIASNSSSSVG